MSSSTNSNLGRARGAKTPRLLGRYHVLGQIGRSAVGALHLARLEGPQGFQRWAAIRIVDAMRAEDPAFLKEFFERAGEGAALLHPNVAALFDVGETEGVAWLATEYLQGERAEEIIERVQAANRPVSWDVAARIAADAAEGLHALHQHKRPDGTPMGLLHGDIAPHSLVVTYAGETKVKGAFEPRARGTLDKRKLPYAAPEQIWNEDADARTDVFALGVILWELCAATKLFARVSDDETRAMVEAGVVPSLCDEVPGFPPEIDSLVRRALGHKKDDRFASARDLARALEAVLVARGVLTRTDDVGTYMKTLFADRCGEHDAQMIEAAQVTEVFMKTRRRLTLPKMQDDTSGLVDLSIPDAENESTVLSDSDELPTLMHRVPDDGQDDLDTTAEKPVADPRFEIDPLPPPEIGAPEADTDEVTAAEEPHPDVITKELPTRVKPRSIPPPPSPPTPTLTSFQLAATVAVPAPPEGDAPPVSRRAPSVPRASVPPPMRASMATRPEYLPAPPPRTQSVPAPPFRSTPPPQMESFAPPPSPYYVPAQDGAVASPQRSTAALAGVVVAIVLFGGFIIAMQSRVEPEADVGAVGTSSATSTVTSVKRPIAPTSVSPPFALPAPTPATIPTIREVNANDLPISTGKRPPPPIAHTAVIQKPPPPPATDPAKTGQLTVICMPACDQVTDGSSRLGPTPIFKRTVVAGKHRLTLHGEDGTQKTVTIDVPEGDVAVVKQSM